MTAKHCPLIPDEAQMTVLIQAMGGVHWVSNAGPGVVLLRSQGAGRRYQQRTGPYGGLKKEPAG